MSVRSRRPRIALRAVTLDEYRAWSATATRNLTDDPIGRHSIARRQADAAASRLIPHNPRRRGGTK